jgi:hypothetical protein
MLTEALRHATLKLYQDLADNRQRNGAAAAGKRSSSWRTYCVALAQRLDVQVGEDLIGLEQLERGDVTCNQVS